MENMFDIHCHAVPGVDDGASSLAEAMEILKREHRDGVRAIILTPHFRRGMFETGREYVKAQFDLLQEEAAQKLPDLNLYLGCEFHSNMDMAELLDECEYYRMAGSAYVLLEFSGGDSKEYIWDRLYQAAAHGFEPIVAHAERYRALWKDLEFAERIERMGARFQVNAGSILGYSGRQPKKFCRLLMEHDLLSYVGSDSHDVSVRPPRMGECAAYMEKKMGKDYAEQILVRNPEKILM